MAYIIIKENQRLAQLSLTGVTEESLKLIHEHKNLLQPLITPVVDELYDGIYQVQHLQQIIDQTSSLEQLKQEQREYL